MAKFKIQKDTYVNQGFDSSAVIGGTGGLTSISGTQIRPNVYVTGGSLSLGSILAQKGKSKFLVTDGTYTGQCTLVNIPAANLSAGQMSIGVDTATAVGNANSFVGGATTYAYVTFATTTLAGVSTPAAGQYVRGTGLSGNVIISSYAVANGLANANVAFSSQTVSNVAATTFYIGGYAARLTNKAVLDYDNNEYFWTFSAPTSTTVRIPGA
jgi:hypothetical protein